MKIRHNLPSTVSVASMVVIAALWSGLSAPAALARSAAEGTSPGAEGGSADATLRAAADRDWRFVQKLEDDGMFDVAARQLVAFAQDHPDDPRAPGALLEAASIHRKLDQPMSALADYEKLLKRFPQAKEAPQALLQKGELLAESHRWEEAASSYRSLLTSFPESPQADNARLGLGESMMALGKAQEAERLFRYLVGGRAAPPLAARALFDLGVLAQEAGEDSLAIRRFDRVVQSYPQEVVAAFGLLRAAEILVRLEAPQAAREHYDTVNRHFKDPYLRARADLGLAILDEEAGHWKEAAARYRAVAERGGSAQQVQRALLGLGESELQAGRPAKAREAAEAFLQKYPDAEDVERARLIMARADAAQGKKDAADALRSLTHSKDPEVAHRAFTTLARWLESRAGKGAADPGSMQVEARDLWRDAALVAPDGDTRAEDYAQAGRLAAETMHRPALAADFYREAADAATTAALQARVLGLRLEQEWKAKEERLAVETARRLIEEHPASAEAARARRELRRRERLARAHPEDAVRRLAELAAADLEDPAIRRLKAGTILREVAGDPAAAAKLFEAAADQASDSTVIARSDFERGRALVDLALDQALTDPPDPQWKNSWEEAKRAFAAAAQAAGTTPEQAGYRLAQLKMELSEAASSTPPLFDAELAPLLAGLGEQEAIGFHGERWRRLADEMVAAMERVHSGTDRAWVLWRAAEIAAAADSTQRIEWLREGIDEAGSGSLEMRLRYTLAQLLMGAGKSEEAAQQLRRVMESPRAGEVAIAARYSMAELQRKERRYTAAGELYSAYASAYPETRRGQRALLLAGDMALYAGDADRAAGIYRSLLERDPEGVYADDAEYRLATAQMRRGRSEDARRRFSRLADPALHSRYAGRSLLKLSELESQVGNDSLAVDALARLEQVDPGLAREEKVAQKLARLELDRGRPESALEWLDRAGEESAELVELRVKALARAGKVDGARETFQRLNEGFPDAAERIAAARCDLADAELKTKKVEAALADYQTVEQEPVTNELKARALYGVGMCRLQTQQWDESKAAFAAAAEAAPSSNWAALGLFKVANLSSRAGDDDDARRAWQELVDRFPEHELHPKAMKGLAVSWRRLNRYDKAIEVYHALLEQHPDFPQAEEILADIAYCYHELGKFELSIAAYQRVLPLLGEEDQAYAQFWIADSLEKLSRPEEAAAAYLKIPYLYPKSGQLPVTAQLKAARVYERMGDVSAAVRLYDKVISQYGKGSQWGAEAQRRLQVIQSKTDADS